MSTCGHGEQQHREINWVLGIASGLALGLSLALPTPRAQAQSGGDRPAAPDLRIYYADKSVALPILNFQGQDDVCEAWIDVQYLGRWELEWGPPQCDDPGAKAMLVVWGEPGFCPPQAAGPMGVSCTGLLSPGATWSISGAIGENQRRGISVGSKSGMLFLFTADRFSETGLVDDLGFDAVIADYLCETLYYDINSEVGSGDYRRFLKAYQEGGGYRGVPLGLASGPGRLAVTVRRRCPSDAVPGAGVTSAYAGLSDTAIGLYDPVAQGFTQVLPLVAIDPGALRTVIYAQNVGLDCAMVELWFRAADACGAEQLCDRRELAAGESTALRLEACAGRGARGSARIWSSERLAVVADLIGPETMTSIAAQAPDSFGASIRSENPAYRGRRSLFGPMVLSRMDGWHTELHVQNLDRQNPARVALEFHAPGGQVAAVLHEWLCPGGSRSFAPAAIHALAPGWTGSVTIDSRAWWSGDGPTVAPADLAAVAVLHRGDGEDGGSRFSSDAGPGSWTEAAAYALFPEAGREYWVRQSPGLPQGAGLLVIPALVRAARGRDPSGDAAASSEVAVMNLAREAGLTRAGFYLFDQNSLVDHVCLSLAGEQTAWVDLDRWGFVAPGFRGAALVSATSWSHAGVDPATGLQRARVSLGAVVLSRAAEDAPGDAASAVEGLDDAAFQGSLPCASDGLLPRCEGE